MRSQNASTNEADQSGAAALFLRGRAFWAERLDVCRATLLRAFKAGELHGYRIGDRVLHSPEQIQAWIERSDE